MKEKLRNVSINFSTEEDGDSEVQILGLKPLVKAGIFYLVARCSEDNGESFEETCHEMLEVSKKIHLQEMSEPFEEEGQRLDCIIKEYLKLEAAKVNSKPIRALLDAILYQIEAEEEEM